MDFLKADKAAHYLMNTWKELQVIPTQSRYSLLYHEDRLYSVRDRELDTITLVYADSEKEALAAARF